MGKSIPVTVGGVQFANKESLTAYIRELIGKYPVGTFISKDDLTFCKDLVQLHSDASNKIGAGISQIEVRLDIFGNKHFQLHRVDKSQDDFSWKHCVTNAKRSQ